MNKEAIVSELKNRSGVKSAKLPSNIDFEIKNSILNIYIYNPWINMQNDSVAFEGWVVVLKRWLPEELIKEVNLNWTSLDMPLFNTATKKQHYNRFLYRVCMFSKLFPGWFKIDREKEDEIYFFSSWLKKNNCILNVPLSNNEISVNNKKNESYIETLFVRNTELLAKKVDLAYIFNQLPVGLFKETVKTNNAVFTGGKSALDIWGINNKKDTVNIFELKYENKKVGIISELLFYVTVLHEACCKRNGMFGFSETKSNDRGIHHLTSQKFEALNGYFLTDSLHPLIDKNVIELLNEGVSNLGNIEIGTLFYEYDGKEVRW